MILRVFPRKTAMTPKDRFAFVGDPPLFRPVADEVHISTAFTWDIEEAERLGQAWGQYYKIVRFDGPAYNNSADGFEPGKYIRLGVTFTSRGCNNQCPWCLAWKREGKLRELPILVSNVIQDNNLLQCSKTHINKVFEMLHNQRAIEFKGGIDAKLLTGEIADDLRSLRIKQIFLACDTKKAVKPLRTAIKRLAMPRDKVRCYVLLKFDANETISDAAERMIEVWEAGAMPFAQLYQPPDHWIEYPREWRHFARLWSRPAAMKAYIMKMPLEVK